MRYLGILLLTLTFSFLGNAQSAGQSKLTGTIYDTNGAVVAGAKVIATNGNAEKFETSTNDAGVFVLELAISGYDSKNSVTKSKEAKYDIVVSSPGFKTSCTKGFVFVPAYGGKMYLDIALEIGPCSHCEPMFEYPIKEIETSIPAVVDKISARPLIEVPRKSEKVRKKPAWH